MEGRNPIGADDIVLTQGQASGTRRGGTQTTGVFESEELAQLDLWRFIQEDLAEVDDGVGMSSNDSIAGNIGLLFGEDGERMGLHGDSGIRDEKD